ncbi:MAG: hypothetical protein GXP11_03525 [Gammaproteobacteria bacterium]|nr:hypothetical protein [Gammaproteobacteria bacterium]
MPLPVQKQLGSSLQINKPVRGGARHYGIESRISWLRIVDDLKQLPTENDVSLQEQKPAD